MHEGPFVLAAAHAPAHGLLTGSEGSPRCLYLWDTATLACTRRFTEADVPLIEAFAERAISQSLKTAFWAKRAVSGSSRLTW